MSDRELQHFRRNIGVLLQDGALFTDLTVFENIATPVREHTNLPEALIRRLVMSKLNAVGLGGIEYRMPHELSGGMARRVAFARAVVLDPDLMLYDEPMTGLDPIAVSTVRTLMRETNNALGLTSLVVTHNVNQMGHLVDYCYIIASAKIAGEGHPEELSSSTNPGVDQFMNGKVEGPIPFPLSAAGCSLESARLNKITEPIAQAGQCLIFLFRMLAGIRFSLSQILTVLQQTYLIGARSLVIIMICGFFVGMVLSLQAINALEQFGASDQVSLLVGKSLFRELGPVLTALLFAGRAGTSITAEIGLMKATNQIEAMELMAIDPIQRIALPRFAAGVISVPLLTAMFNAMAILGSVVFSIGVMDLDSGIFWSKLANRHLLPEGLYRRHLEKLRFRRDRQPDCSLFRIFGPADRRRRRNSHHQHGGIEFGPGTYF